MSPVLRKQEVINIFEDCPTGSKFLDDAELLEPQAAPLCGILQSAEPTPLACDAVVCARVSAGDKVNSLEPIASGVSTFPHIVEFWNIWPVLVQDPQAVAVLLDLPQRPEPRHVKPHIDAANAGVRAAVRHLRRCRSWSAPREPEFCLRMWHQTVLFGQHFPVVA